MNRKAAAVITVLLLFSIALTHFSCENNPELQPEEKLTYLNHHDSVSYVGMKACIQCHSDKHATFIHTGMGLSFDSASIEKSAARKWQHVQVYDKYRDFYYRPLWKGDEFYIQEFRLSGKDTIHNLFTRVDYIIGSGQHTNSHILDINGYLFQAPLTWYTQKGKWDLPPGFENGNNTRFSRLIGFECMSCHNGLPSFVPNSENRFTRVPDGIDCERCHGPGELHVKQKLEGIVVDVSKEIDRTIVNPSKLPWKLQVDVCQRCHLQGNAVLKKGKDFDDFRPGQELSSVMDVFMPLYDNDDRFIMASHAQRFQMSPCFIQSNRNTDKEGAKLDFTCITCHNPHVSVTVTGRRVFNSTCLNCHKQESCTEDKNRLHQFEFDCIKCHMPVSGTEDIPHVTVHDHYIRKPDKEKNGSSGPRTFRGIYAINNTSPDLHTKAKAWLQYYERFDRNSRHLDSALTYIISAGAPLEQQVHYYYLKGDFSALVNLVKSKKVSSEDPWTCYRIARAFQNTGDMRSADLWYSRACSIATDNFSMKAEWAALKIALNDLILAEKLIDEVLELMPSHTLSLNNKGWLLIQKGELESAERYLAKALLYDPDYVNALYNLANVKFSLGKKAEAKTLAKRIVRQNPDHLGAKKILRML